MVSLFPMANNTTLVSPCLVVFFVIMQDATLLKHSSNEYDLSLTGYLLMILSSLENDTCMKAGGCCSLINIRLSPLTSTDIDYFENSLKSLIILVY